MSKFFIRVEIGEYKISKKTKQRRKIEKKSSFSTGLPTGFSKTLLRKQARELRHIYFQMYYTKTHNIKREKIVKTQKKKGGQRGGKKIIKKGGKPVKSIGVARKLKKKKKKSL